MKSTTEIPQRLPGYVIKDDLILAYPFLAKRKYIKLPRADYFISNITAKTLKKYFPRGVNIPRPGYFARICESYKYQLEVYNQAGTLELIIAFK